jgi:GT2 family glycosyltransferase
VVDNNSQDDTLKLIANYPGIIIFENDYNLGFGKANNIGIQFALENGADYVYLLNHDAYLIESVLDNLIQHFEQNPQFGILTPLQVKANKLALEENFARFLAVDGVLTEMVNDCSLRRTENVLYEVPFAQAASWIIKKDTIEKIGLFNPLFFHYGEDNDYLNRLKYHGYKLGVITNKRIVHLANPLNMNHQKNYNQYHRNRVFNQWLIKHLDINVKFDFVSWLNSLIPYGRELILSLLKLSFLRSFRICKLLFRMLKVSINIKSNRNMNTNVFIS